jgi:hypothetical protein
MRPPVIPSATQPASILEHNLYGLDIDDRAFQLAYFAVMMKARQYNRRILNGETDCHVYAIQESNGINRNHLRYFGAGMSDREHHDAQNQLNDLLDTFTDAKEYGSILNVEPCNWDLLRRFAAQSSEEGQQSLDSMGLETTKEQILQLISIGQAMAQKYEAVITNPPYMGSGRHGMKSCAPLSEKNYPDSKADLFAAVFGALRPDDSGRTAYQAMITQHAWMFLSSFAALRQKLLKRDTVNMAHLGAHAFEEIGGEVVQTTCFCAARQPHRGLPGRVLPPGGTAHPAGQARNVSARGKPL